MRRGKDGVSFEAGDLRAVAYVTCGHGVCLEVGTLILDRPAKTASKDRLRSVDIEILFNLGSDTVHAGEVAKLQEISAALNDPLNRVTRFAIIGHTDSTGNDDYNCRLAMRRAGSVRQRLGELGVAIRRLDVIGAGEFLLRYRANGTAPENRRVGFVRIAEGGKSVLRRMSQLCTNRR